MTEVATNRNSLALSSAGESGSGSGSGIRTSASGSGSRAETGGKRGRASRPLSRLITNSSITPGSNSGSSSSSGGGAPPAPSSSLPSSDSDLPPISSAPSNDSSTTQKAAPNPVNNPNNDTNNNNDASNANNEKKKIGRRVLTTASGKKVVQIPTENGGVRTVVVKRATQENKTSRVSLEDGKIVQRKVVVCPDGKRRIVVHKSDRRQDEDDEDDEEKAKANNRKAIQTDPMQMDIAKQGYLKKQFGRNTAWIKMWFVLRGHFLLAYKDHNSSEAPQTTKLTGFRVVPIAVKRLQLKYVFQIFHPMRMDLDNILFLQASEESEYNEWIESFEKAMGIAKATAKAIKKPAGDADRMEKLRERMLARQKIQQDEKTLKKELLPIQASTINTIITHLCTHGGLTTSDLLSLDPVIHQQARNLYARQIRAASQGQDLDLDPETDDMRTTMAFLRIYLSQIDRPLLTFGQYDEFVSSYHKFLALNRVERYRSLIEILPATNKDCVKRLLEFFCYVSFNTEKNGCSIHNLVETFGNAILRPYKEKEGDDRETAPKVVGFLIRRAYLLFPNEGNDDDDDQKARVSLRKEIRFGDDVQLPGTGAGAMHHSLQLIGTGKTIENVKVYRDQVAESSEKFSREVGTHGYFLLIDRQIENLQGQITRLATAKEEIKKWGDVEEDLTKHTEYLKDLKTIHNEAFQEIQAKFEEKLGKRGSRMAFPK